MWRLRCSSAVRFHPIQSIPWAKLDVALDVPVPVKPFGERVGLNIGVIDAQQRVGKRVLSVELVISVVGEVYVAVGARKDRLILAAALRVEARLDRVRADDLRHIINEVERVILVDERQPVVIGEWEGLVSDPAVTEIRDVTGAHVREQLRHVDVVCASQCLVVGRLQLDEIAARSEDEFVGQRRAEGVRQSQHTI